MACIPNETDIRIYFDGDCWNKFSDLEKTRYMNQKRNYEVLKSAGLNPKVPYFMQTQKKSDKEIRQKPKTKEGRERRKSAKKPEKCAFIDETWKCQPIGFTEKNKKELSILFEFALKRCIHLDGLLRKSKVVYQPSIEYRRYPSRNISKKCYTEEEIPSEDEFLHYPGDCPLHEDKFFIPDRKMKMGSVSNHILETCPPFLSVCRSGIKGAGLGVWTELKLPKGVVFGPYKGKILRNQKAAWNTGYSWQVCRFGQVQHYVEASDTSISNWMRFVNCADCEERQNLVAFQFRSKIYYKTHKEIMQCTELLVWYGEAFAKELGICRSAIEESPTNTDKRYYECNTCHVWLATKDFLAKHERRQRHEGHERRHRCPFCLYSTDYSSHQRKHQLIHTKERPHRCHHCGKTFTRNMSLKVHLRIHTGEKSYECVDCGKKFRSCSSLCNHKRIHAKIRPYVCNICEKAFAQRVNLNRHTFTHTGQRPYACSKCDYRASLRSNFSRHVAAVHTKIRPYVCNICEKAFAQRVDLNKHTLTHTGQRPYACSKCDYRASQRSNLSRHVAAVHTKLSPTCAPSAGKQQS